MSRNRKPEGGRKHPPAEPSGGDSAAPASTLRLSLGLRAGFSSLVRLWAGRQRHPWSAGELAWLLAVNALTFLVFLHHVAAAPFSPDSWSYYELSRSVFGDFFKTSTWRQYAYASRYGSSYTPAWPVAIALFNALVDQGIWGGYCLSFLLCVAISLLLGKISRLLFGSRVSGYFLYLGLFSNYYFAQEAVAARSFPMAVFWMLCCLWIFLSREKLNRRALVLLGVFSGLANLTRFDWMLAGLSLGLLAAWLLRPNWRESLAYYGAYFATISPWVLYSLVHFSRPWDSDNARRVLAAVPLEAWTYVKSYPTVFDAPALWWQKTLLRGGRVLANGCDAIFWDYFFLALLLAYLLLSFAFQGARQAPDERQAALLRRLRLFSLLTVSLLLTFLLTGIWEIRYFITTVLLLSTLLLFTGWVRFGKWYAGTAAAMLLLCLMGINRPPPALQHLGPLKGASIVFPFFERGFDELRRTIENQRQPLEYRGLLACLGSERSSAKILFLDGSFIPFKFGALTGIETFQQPTNLGADNVVEFFEDFKITHYYAPSGAYRERLETRYAVRQPCALPLYRVERNETATKPQPAEGQPPLPPALPPRRENLPGR